MATYAAYRHIELDKVGHGKKRVRNRSSEIFQALCSPTDSSPKSNTFMARRASQGNDSFQRLFGAPENRRIPPRRGSLTNQDVNHRNPVTGNGVSSWDAKPTKPKTKVFKERNPVTGETYLIPVSTDTPTKLDNNSTIYIKSEARNGNI
ncbi:microtubule-associated protein Jupiter-like isoform X2 [Euwallacea fornicatus]|uniref:microtubule-associated protein Jupiter-like isoform X2 n=1 Tax=Euwallacea fornicatus TaxID=995702 RepID=UPI00338E7FD8